MGLWGQREPWKPQQVLSEHSLLQWETLQGPESFSWWRSPGPSFHVLWLVPLKMGCFSEPWA